LEYIHSHSIIHWDLKIANILVCAKSGDIKIADLGLARRIGYPSEPYTWKVVTLWYWAPEILLGIGTYGTEVDIWALGCIFGELMQKGQPLMPG